MKYQRFISDEYKEFNQQPVYCRLGNENIMIPWCYQGDKEKFIDDLLSFQDGEYLKYDDYNTQNPDNRIDIPEVLKAGDIYIQPPLASVLKGMSDKQIIQKVIQSAKRRYRAAIKKTLRAKKEYADRSFMVSVDPRYLAELDIFHRRYCINKLNQGLSKTFKWSASQAANVLGGAAAALPAAAYYLLDKKIHFADSQAHRFIKEEALPYIRKGVLKALIPIAVISGIKAMGNKTSSLASDETSSAMIASETNHNDAFEKKYKITDLASFEQLYQDAFPLVIQSLLPTEILVTTPYADNGRTVNTAGLGSYWFPENGDPQSSKWIKTRDYVKKHPNLKLTGRKSIELADGWSRAREGGRVYNNMYKRLKGAEINCREFAAIFSCNYNNEEHGMKLCSFVRENYQDPLACAAFIMSLRPQNSSFEDGIAKRHTHEALMYLNINRYAEKIPDFMIKEGINSKGAKYHVSSVTQLNPQVCRRLEESLATGKTDYAAEVANMIYNYRCKNGQTLSEICRRHGIEDICVGQDREVHYEDALRLTESKDLYAKALEAYNKGDYTQALDGFRTMLKKGYNGADIHNDMAITYFNLKDYDNCIAECQSVLATGETEQYAAANFNAGKAYEKLGNRAKALENYKLAQKRDPDCRVYVNAVNKLQPQKAPVRPQKRR